MKYTHHQSRNSLGSQLVEFAASLMLFAICILIPLVDLIIVPIRGILVQELINKETRRLAFSENLSTAFNLLENDKSFLAKINKLGGIKVEASKLYLKITNAEESRDSIILTTPSKISEKYLPTKPGIPYTYTLTLELKLSLYPAFLLSPTDKGLPGINTPFPIVLRSSHSWENLGCNPETGNFFLNE